jgi:tetratricopeptide (TPR) repeat protein
MRKSSVYADCWAVLWWLGAAVCCFGQANFNEGETLFMQNKPREALAFLENAVADDPSHAQAYLYLGIAYEQLGRTGEAIAAYRKILDRAGDLNVHVVNNLGNVYFKEGDMVDAEQCYSQAIETDPAYASAYLGRANARVKAGSLRAALDDYELYLILEPASRQRSNIERMLSFIRSEFAAEERRKLAVEEKARLEAEQRRRVLDEVTSSLQSAAGASQGLSSGAEQVEEYAGEFELE